MGVSTVVERACFFVSSRQNKPQVRSVVFDHVLCESVYCTQNVANVGNVASREVGFGVVRGELLTEKSVETALQAGGRGFNSLIAHFRKFCCINGLRELDCVLLLDVV